MLKFLVFAIILLNLQTNSLGCIASPDLEDDGKWYRIFIIFLVTDKHLRRIVKKKNASSSVILFSYLDFYLMILVTIWKARRIFSYEREVLEFTTEATTSDFSSTTAAISLSRRENQHFYPGRFSLSIHAGTSVHCESRSGLHDHHTASWTLENSQRYSAEYFQLRGLLWLHFSTSALSISQLQDQLRTASSRSTSTIVSL